MLLVLVSGIKKEWQEYGKMKRAPSKRGSCSLAQVDYCHLGTWALCYQSFQFFKRSQKSRLLCELSQLFSVLAQTNAFSWLYKKVWHLFFRRHWHPFYLDWLIWWEQEVHMPMQIKKGEEVQEEGGEWGRHSAMYKDNKYWCFTFYQNIYIPPNWVLEIKKIKKNIGIYNCDKSSKSCAYKELRLVSSKNIEKFPLW